LDAEFEADETRKSRLLLEARVLREQLNEVAAEKFAQAAVIEERLSDSSGRAGLLEKSFVHRFSAASCWGQAGNFYRAIVLCDELAAHDDPPARLRERVTEYAETLRARRARWYADLVSMPAAAEP